MERSGYFSGPLKALFETFLKLESLEIKKKQGFINHRDTLLFANHIHTKPDEFSLLKSSLFFSTHKKIISVPSMEPQLQIT